MAKIAKNAIKLAAIPQDSLIGTIVAKTSGKPFQNGEFTATVTDITINPHSGKDAVDLGGCVGAVNISQLVVVPLE